MQSHACKRSMEFWTRVWYVVSTPIYILVEIAQVLREFALTRMKDRERRACVSGVCVRFAGFAAECGGRSFRAARGRSDLQRGLLDFEKPSDSQKRP